MYCSLLFHCISGCLNVPQCYVYTYIACFRSSIISTLCQYWGKWRVVLRNLESYKTGTLRDVLCGSLDWSSTVLCKCCTAMGGMLELFAALLVKAQGKWEVGYQLVGINDRTGCVMKMKVFDLRWVRRLFSSFVRWEPCVQFVTGICKGISGVRSGVGCVGGFLRRR
jgi:hypothetical protein